jgi:NADH-quinone oxidoreductase subunit G
MEGQPDNPPSSLVPFYWTPGWNSVQALNNYLDEPNGSMKGGDPGIRLIEQANNVKFHKL